MAQTRTKLTKNVSTWTANTSWWVDLITSDETGAREFYGPLLGWEFVTGKMAGGGLYRIAQRDGLSLAGLMGKTGEMQQMPTQWNMHISVDDVTAAAGQVTAAGGTVAMGPFEVGTAGHSAAVIDPQGASFMLWQPSEMPGAEAVNSPGAITWLELATADVEGAQRFYSEVFDWTFEAMEGAGTYWLIKRDGAMIGGLTSTETPGNAGRDTSAWNVCFGIEDADKAAQFVESHDGAVTHGPMDSPYGRLVGVRDPQGATFSLLGLTKQHDPAT